MFGKRKQSPIPFDRGGRVPVIRSSICTGEQTAGFKDPVSGKFQEYILIQNDRDLREFMERYQVTVVLKALIHHEKKGPFFMR